MKHWIFDFDGTLVDTDGQFSHCLGYALEPFGVDVGKDFMEKIRHKHPYRIFEDILNPEQADEAMRRLRVVGEEISLTTQAFEGMDRVLKTLSQASVSLSVWTGRDGLSTHRILKHIGLHNHFDKIISGTCVPVNKPGQDGLVEIQKHFSAQTDEMVMVGDHHHDIDPANEMGVVSVHAQWKKIPHALPEKTKPNYAFGSVDQFHEWVVKQLR